MSDQLPLLLVVPGFRASNLERTGWRDMEYSRMMRLVGTQPDDPAYELARSCDFDPTVICALCKLPVFLAEASAAGLKEKPTTFTRKLARAAGVPAYLFRRNLPDRAPTDYLIQNLQTWEECGPWSEDEVVAWMNRVVVRHYQQRHTGL